MPSAISASGAAIPAIMSSVVSRTAGSATPLSPNRVPDRIAMMIGFLSTLFSVAPKPRAENSPWRAHSTLTVTSVHRISELNTSTSATAGTAASPSSTRANGSPSMTLFENTPPSANTDCDTPSSANSFHATRRPSANTTRQLPKKAISRRASTGGSVDRPLIRRNSMAGSAAANTKRPSASPIASSQLPMRIRPKPASTSRNSGAESVTWWMSTLIAATVPVGMNADLHDKGSATPNPSHPRRHMSA